MSLRYSSREDVVCLFDSVTEWAFGPVFHSEEDAESFLEYAEALGVRDGDVRRLTNDQLTQMWDDYCKAKS